MMVADSLCEEPDFLSSAGRIGQIASFAMGEYQNFCELGAISPDLPYLDLLHANSKGWANVMHYWRTSDIIRSGVSYFATRILRFATRTRLRLWLGFLAIPHMLPPTSPSMQY